MTKPEFFFEDERALTAEAIDIAMAELDPPARLELILKHFPDAVFMTGFSLADQALTHLIASLPNRISIVVDPTRFQEEEDATLQDITEQRYGFSFVETDDSRAAFSVRLTSQIPEGGLTSRYGFFVLDDGSGKLWINPLADWSEDSIIEHVLAHEVPVNPHDMPGFIREAA